MLDAFANSITQFAEASLGEPLFAVPVYILVGLASSLFPCVYPLIPVTVGFIRARSREGQSPLLHPFFYWLGTILAYALLGTIAAISGGAFNVWLRNGFVILAFGFLFLYLSFVTMDWVELNFQFGDRLVQKASKKSGLPFTVLMGLAAGFIASACVAPALVTMLLFIAKHSAEAAGTGYLTTIGYGTLLSTSFGFGIGIPFFLAGVAGARLPKSGTWMQVVKYAFALAIGLYALLELQKGLLVLGVSSMNTNLILGGIVLIFCAVLLGLRPPEPSDLAKKTRFFFALVALAFALGLIVRGLASPAFGASASSTSGLPKKNATGVATEAQKDPLYGRHEMVGKLKFHRSDAEARALAAKENKAIFIDFYADWCSNCKDFSRDIQRPGPLQNALQKAVLLKIYDTDPVFERYAEDPLYGELQIGLPFFLVLTPQGRFHWKGNNYRDHASMIRALKEAAGR